MKKLMTKNELIAFEEDIAECFNNKMIKAPVHLDNGNEEQLIEIFKEVQEDDYVCCTWRAHYRCLLKGVDPQRLKDDIISGKSITLCYKDHNIFSSAIVGGILPIALGIAFDLKRKNSPQKVWCFVGDMSSECGTFYEAAKYAENFDLPLYLVIEDNGKSVKTETRQAWGNENLFWLLHNNKKIKYFKYENKKYEHAGTGTRIQF